MSDFDAVLSKLEQTMTSQEPGISVEELLGILDDRITKNKEKMDGYRQVSEKPKGIDIVDISPAAAKKLRAIFSDKSADSAEVSDDPASQKKLLEEIKNSIGGDKEGLLTKIGNKLTEWATNIIGQVFKLVGDVVRWTVGTFTGMLVNVSTFLMDKIKLAITGGAISGMNRMGGAFAGKNRWATILKASGIAIGIGTAAYGTAKVYEGLEEIKSHSKGLNDHIGQIFPKDQSIGEAYNQFTTSTSVPSGGSLFDQASGGADESEEGGSAAASAGDVTAPSYGESDQDNGTAANFSLLGKVEGVKTSSGEEVDMDLMQNTVTGALRFVTALKRNEDGSIQSGWKDMEPGSINDPTLTEKIRKAVSDGHPLSKSRDRLLPPPERSTAANALVASDHYKTAVNNLQDPAVPRELTSKMQVASWMKGIPEKEHGRIINHIQETGTIPEKLYKKGGNWVTIDQHFGVPLSQREDFDWSKLNDGEGMNNFDTNSIREAAITKEVDDYDPNKDPNLSIESMGLGPVPATSSSQSLEEGIRDMEDEFELPEEGLKTKPQTAPTYEVPKKVGSVAPTVDHNLPQVSVINGVNTRVIPLPAPIDTKEMAVVVDSILQSDKEVCDLIDNATASLLTNKPPGPPPELQTGPSITSVFTYRQGARESGVKT